MNVLEIMNIPYYKKGNTIHIKKENRGKFTRSAKEHSMGVQEFATHILNNKDKYNSTLIKRANFAKNAKKFKHAKGGLIKKCQNGEILDDQQIYIAGYTDPVTITANKKLTKKQQMQADEEWREYLKQHPIQIGSEEYNRLPEKAKAQVYKNSVTNAIDKAALPTAAAIIAPTALTAGATSLVSSEALTAIADAAGKVGTKIAGTNLGKAAGTFINNPYIDMGLTALGAYTVPSLYNSGISNIKQGNYGRALGDFASIGLEGLGFLGTVNNIKNVYGPINKMMNGIQTKGVYTEPTTSNTRTPSSKTEITSKYVINDTPGYQLKILMRGNPLEKQLSKEGTISINSIRALAQKGSNVEQEIINKILNSEEFVGQKVIDYNKFRKAVQDELVVYDRVPHEKYKDYGIERLGMNYADPAGLSITGWENLTPETFVFESSKIPIGNATHYNNNTLGHSRTYTTTTEPNILHVMESQSDWGQKSKISNLTKFEKEAIKNIDKAIQNGGDGFSTVEELLLKKQTILDKANQRWKNNSYQAQYLHDNYLQRQLQENMKLAAERGQTKMRYPTSETAAKIEGYKKIQKTPSNYEVRSYLFDNNHQYKQDDKRFIYLRYGLQHERPRTLQDDLEMEALKLRMDKAYQQAYEYLSASSYRPEHQTILKKYSDFPKMFKKFYKNQEVRTVTDPQGNTWYEVDVPKDYLNQEWQYKCGGKVKKKLIKKRK